ncbi:integrase, catalytic region, zinc finger, CCHC-type containing protein [Tanacetum coccineum]
MEADDQAIQIILIGRPEDIYAAVDNCETTQEIWLRVQQMMKGSNIGIQDKKDKLFNEWKRFTSTDGESIESYYHRFSKLMNDFKRKNTFQKRLPTISSGGKVLKGRMTSKSTQLYDFLKYNQKEYPVFHPDLPSSSTYIQQPLPNNNNYIPQPSFNHNYMQQPMPNLKDITDPTAAMNTILALMAKAFKLNYSTPTNNNQRISSNPRNRQIPQPSINLGQVNQMQMVGGNGWNQFAGQNVGNQNGNGNVVAARAEGNANGNNGNQIRCYNYRGLGHLARNCTVRPRRRDAAYLQTQLLIAQKEEAGI